MSKINPKVLEKFEELNAPMHRVMDEVREYLNNQRNLPRKQLKSSPKKGAEKIKIGKH